MSVSRESLLIRRVLIAVGLVFTLVTMAIVAADLSARRTRRIAEKFLTEFTALKIGESTFEDARMLADRFNGQAYPVNGSETGSPPDLQYAFGFENTWLHRLHIAVPTILLANVTVGNGRVTGRGFRYGSVTPSRDSEFGVSDGRGEGPPFEIRHYRGRGYWMIYLTPAASPEQRRLAYALNLECLSKLGGCKLKQELLPALWQNLRSLGGYTEM